MLMYVRTCWVIGSPWGASVNLPREPCFIFLSVQAFLAEDDATQLQEVQERLETVEAQIEYKTTDIEVQRRQSMASVLNGNGAEAGEEAKTPSRVRHRKVAKGVHDALAVAFKVGWSLLGLLGAAPLFRFTSPPHREMAQPWIVWWYCLRD